jgi:xylose isomerase
VDSLTFGVERARALRGERFDFESMRGTGYAYERLDQLTMELLLGVR